MASQDVHLRDFEPNLEVSPFPTVLLVGKRAAGKSTAAVSIAAKYGVPRWAAWCGTKETEAYWAKVFGSSASVWGTDDRGMYALDRIVAFQQDKVTFHTQVKKEDMPAKYTIGLIFDDVTGKREFRRHAILEELFSNGRHFKCVIIISCQYPKQLPPAVRMNSDYIFMMHNNKRTCRILHEEYVENPENFNTFISLLKAVTNQKSKEGRDLYNALVYNNCVKTHKLEEMFFIFRSHENPLELKLGSESWRSFNQDHYKSREEAQQRKIYNRKQRIGQYQDEALSDSSDEFETHRLPVKGGGHIRLNF